MAQTVLNTYTDEELMLDPPGTWFEPTLTPTSATCIPPYLAGAGATLGFSVSMMVSVIIAVTPPDTAELPKPPKPGAFLPCLSASLLACCSSFALRRISAFASRSCVWRKREEPDGALQPQPCPAQELSVVAQKKKPNMSI